MGYFGIQEKSCIAVDHNDNDNDNDNDSVNDTLLFISVCIDALHSVTLINMISKF